MTKPPPTVKALIKKVDLKRPIKMGVSFRCDKIHEIHPF